MDMEFRSCYYCSLFVFLNVLIFVHSISNCIQDEQAVQLNHRLVQEHNEYRKLHGVPPLEADANLMQGSIVWSRKLNSEGALRHSTSNGHYGENLYRTSATGPPNESTLDPVRAWYNEIKMYRGDFSKGTGHYSQVVWKNSRKVGCGVCGGLGGTYVTCRYFPPGNYRGQFEENVLPPKHNRKVVESRSESVANAILNPSIKLVEKLLNFINGFL